MSAAEGAFLYVLRCNDRSLYVGTTRTTLELRLAQHNSGIFGGYTAARTPVTLGIRSGSIALPTPSPLSVS
jgi:putative endonuclease